MRASARRRNDRDSRAGGQAVLQLPQGPVTGLRHASSRATAPASMTDVPGAGKTPLGRGLQQGLLWGAVTGALIAIVEGVDTALAGFDGPIAYLAWYAASSLIFAFSLLGGALAAWSCAVVRMLPRRPGKLRALARA